ncbi:50S ribosomal protein L3 [Arenimonas sp.]|nr:50S ribosomal protein L3 [Candidatus Parcubacteria bacterium]
MKYSIATKLNMTQLFDENGKVYPATILSYSDLKVTQSKSVEKDGYEAIQFGFGSKSKNQLSKAVLTHSGVNNEKKGFALLKEVKGISATKGDILSFDFVSGDLIEATGITKAKGFQGVVKRYNFKGGPRSHGQKHSERERGSSGAGGYQRVFKGTRMAGRMGGDRMTFKNLTVISVDVENKLVYIKGAIPGRRGTVIEIKQK